jgi:lipopolysaccharide/colanic/teichoic acid biosynthesis glycosyltransferase
MDSKRIFDFIMAFFGIIIVSPVFAVVSLINKLTGNDVFFIQQRVGENSKLFPLIKFATMDKNAHIVGGTLTCKKDSRVTRLGGFLRKSKINEFTQLINVLRGDMSFVGPRPLPLSEVNIYPPKVAKKIYSIKPGITGLASLYFHNEEMLLSHDKESAEATFRNTIMPKKAELELWYVDNRKFILDLKIIIATVLIVCIPHYSVLSFISKRLGGSEIRQKIEDVLKMQHELSSEDAPMLGK